MQNFKSNLVEKVGKEKVLTKFNHKRQKTQINFNNAIDSEQNKNKLNNSQFSTIFKENNSSMDSSRSEETSVITNSDNKSFTYTPANVIYNIILTI